MSAFRGRELQVGIMFGLVVVIALLVHGLLPAPPEANRTPDGPSDAGPAVADRPDPAAPAPGARDGSRASGASEEVASTSDEPVEASPEPTETGAVAGSVTARDADVAGVSVSVEGSSAVATTGEDGGFALDGVPPGHRTVVARGPDGSRGEARVSVRAGETALVHVHLGSGTARLEGRVLAGNRPAAGADLLLLEASGGPGLPAATGSTADDGTFAFDGLEPGAHRLLAETDGGRRADRAVDLLPGERRTVELLLEPGATIAGRVVDGSGRPLEGIPVRAHATGGVEQHRPKTAETRRDGSFAIRGLAGGTAYLLRADGDAEHPGTMRQGVRAPADGIEIVLDRGGAILCRVVDGDGAPVRGVHVRASPPGMQAFMNQGRSGPAGPPEEVEPGVYRVAPLAPGEWSVRARSSDHAPAASEPLRVEAGETREVELRLTAGGPVEGRVVDARGEPVAGARVVVVDAGRQFLLRMVESMIAGSELRPDREEAGSSTDADEGLDRSLMNFGLDVRSARSGEDGRFRIGHAPPGRAVLGAYHRAHPPGTASAEIPESPPAPEVEVRLPAGGAIAGTVRDVDGQPLTSGLIAAQTMTGGGRHARLAEDGSFRVEGLRPGGYMVMYMEQGTGGMGGSMETRSARVRAGEEATVEIVVGQGTRLTGRLVRAGRPVAGATLQLFASGGMMEGFEMTRTDGDGRFVVDGIRPGDYRAMVTTGTETGAMGQATLDVSVPDRAEADLTLELPTTAIAGRVVEATTGEPVAAASVSARDAANRDAGVREAFDGPWGSATTDGDGRFRLEGLPPGTFDLQVAAEGYPVTFERDVRAREGRETELELLLDPGVTVQGTVLGPGDRPVAGARLVLVDPRTGATDYGWNFRGETGTDGRFELEAVRPGTFDVYAYAPEHAETRLRDVTLRGHEDLRIPMAAEGSFELTCRRPDGTPVDGATIEVRYPDGEEVHRYWDPGAFLGYGRTTDGEGRVRKGGLGAGTYTVRVEGPDGSTAGTEVRVETGGTTEREVVLP